MRLVDGRKEGMGVYVTFNSLSHMVRDRNVEAGVPRFFLPRTIASTRILVIKCIFFAHRQKIKEMLIFGWRKYWENVILCIDISLTFLKLGSPYSIIVYRSYF